MVGELTDHDDHLGDHKALFEKQTLTMIIFSCFDQTHRAEEAANSLETSL